MVLPFALWGTAMAAMAPLVDSAGPVVVASLRLLPAGVALLIAVPFLGRSWTILKVIGGGFPSLLLLMQLCSSFVLLED